jgi:hypothetical protein
LQHAAHQRSRRGREGPTRFVYPVPAKPRLVDCVPRVVNTSARKPPSFADARTNHGHENGEPQPFEQRHADLEASTRAERRPGRSTDAHRQSADRRTTCCSEGCCRRHDAKAC